MVSMLFCGACDYEFFAHDPVADIANDQLDKTRLASAGLDIPTIGEDFSNGIAQSERFLSSLPHTPLQGSCVLEVGCSWGYLLDLVRQGGEIPYGVEINAVRRHFVEKELGITCFSSLEDCADAGLQFTSIFMPYVIEYVADPITFITKAISLLAPAGRLVLVTPNRLDALRSVWRNSDYERFFYDFHAINYFSPKAISALCERAGGSQKVQIETRQGYSFMNHASWYLTGRPRTTGVVGGDRFVEDITYEWGQGQHLGSVDEARIEAARLLKKFDADYRNLLCRHELGNQIFAIVTRGAEA